MGEEIDYTKLFFKDNNGVLVPFEGIKHEDIICCDEITNDMYNLLPEEGNIEIVGYISKRDCRRLKKKLRADILGCFRKERLAIRHKERSRRNLLKSKNK